MSSDRLSSLEAEIQCLKRQMKQQRELTRNLNNWVDTMASPLVKRLWWALRGFRWHRVGRWYGRGQCDGWPLPDRKK